MRKAIPALLVLGCSLLSAWGTQAVADEKTADEEIKSIEPAAVNLGRPVDFERDIFPILDANCIACHNLAISESGLIVEDVESILKGGDRGPSVVPKQPEKSLLYQAASHAAEPLMPPLPNKVEARALTPQELGLLRQWILEGATEGAGSMSDQIQWRPFPESLNQVFSVALSPWGRLAAAGRANQVFVYDLLTGEEVARLNDPQLTTLQHEGRPMYPQGAAHRDFVHTLAFNPDGTLLASGGYRVIKLWQRPQNVQLRQIAAGQPITALAVNAQGTVMALAGADHVIRLWNPNDGQSLGELTGHTAPVTSLHFLADGSRLLSGSADKTVRVWQIADKQLVGQVETPSEVNAVLFHPEGTQVITGHADHQIRVWATPTPPAKEEKPAAEEDKPAEVNEEQEAVKPVREIPGHGQPVTSLAWIGSAGSQFVSGSEDGTVRIWDVNNGQQVRTMNHGGPVTAVAASPDGKRLASASSNKTAKIWETGNGKQLAEMKENVSAQRQVTRLTEDLEVAKQRDGLAKAAVDAAEKSLKDRSESLKQAKEAREKADKAVAEAQKKADEATEALEAAKKAASEKPDDQELKKKVEQAEAEAKKQAEALEKAKEELESAQRSLELAEKAEKQFEQELAQAKADKQGTEEKLKEAQSSLEEANKVEAAAGTPFRTIAFSADGKRIVTAGDDHTLRLWDGEAGKPLESYSGHAAPIVAVVFGPEGTLISGSADKTAIVWETRPEWKLVARLGASDEDPLDVSQSPFASRVLCLDFSPDGKWLAVGGGEPSRTGELMIWDVEQRSLARHIEDAHSDSVFGVEFSRDGQYLLTGAADKFVKIHEVATGKFLKSFEGHTHHVLDVSWKADGSTIVSAGADNAIKVWNVETGEQKRTISNYSKQVTSIQFIGVGEEIVSCGGDRTVRFHKTSNGQNFRNFGGCPDYVYSAAANRDGSLVIAGGEDGVLRVWNGTNGQALRNFEPPPPPADDAQASAAGQTGK